MDSASGSNAELSEKRKLEAMEVFAKYPNAVPQHLQQQIMNQRVSLGMDPYMARLAAGAFSYRVDADIKIWAPNADPLNVLWAQSQHPDDSKIWMTFQTDTQFPGEGVVEFKVYFEHGQAIEITKTKEI